MIADLITHYEFELTEPGCAPGSGRYGVRVTLSEDISPVFPYLNALLDDAYYDHANKVLIGSVERHRYAFRSTEIVLAGVNEVAQAPGAVREVITLVNRVWREKENIKPSFVERKLPTAIDIYRFLPKTNCRQCGCATCLVFASELRTASCQLEKCLPLFLPENLKRLESIKKLFLTE
jgi:ArsR family metal-binding transcriptional regulator